VGVVLSVTPQISEDRWITLGIDPMISDLIQTVVSQNGSSAPVIDVKQSSSLVRLQDRTTVRISGLLQTKHSQFTRKIPILGQIPLIKYLFQWTYSKDVRKELVIFITPRII
jgi:type II secretory pathway component GspD/PulD (secretin)